MNKVWRQPPHQEKQGITPAVSLDEALVAGVTAGLANVSGNAVNRGTTSGGTTPSGGATTTAPNLTPQLSGPSGTGLTAAQRTALSDLSGVTPALTSTAPTGIMTTAPVQSSGPSIDTTNRGQQTQEGQIADAVFTDIPANPNVRVTTGLRKSKWFKFDTLENPNETIIERLARRGS